MSKTAGTLIKQSFSQRAKRLGLIPTTERSDIDERQQLSRFRNCEFNRWDLSVDEHKELYKAGKCKCFQCLIHWPLKNNVEHPMYPWQQEIFDALQQYKLIAILKARGVGASELLIRYCFWLCVRNNDMRNKNMAIVTGIREDLSLELLRRFRNLMPSLNWNTRENIAELNGCRVVGYPSKRVKDLRGLTEVAFVMCDEFAFFDPSDQQQILPVLEAFQAKSDPTICLLSTPGALNDEFYNLYQQPANECRYHRLYIPIQKALGSLISEQEAQKVRRQGNYKQEFELRFGTYGDIGSIFNIADIDFAIKQGEQYNNPAFNPKAAKVRYPYIEPNAEIYSIGADVGGWGNSSFGITMVSVFDNKIHVLASEAHGPRVDEDEMIARLISLRNKTPRPSATRIWIDGSAVSFIRRLKSSIGGGEDPNYQDAIEYNKKHGWIKPGTEELDMMSLGFACIPVSFARRGAEMLSNLYVFLSRGDIVIHPKFRTLISELQSAKNLSNTNNRNAQFMLDKRTNSMDTLDSLRLALFPLDAGAPEFEENEEEEGEEESNA
jgi:hypothetical protein